MEFGELWGEASRMVKSIRAKSTKATRSDALANKPAKKSTTATPAAKPKVARTEKTFEVGARVWSIFSPGEEGGQEWYAGTVVGLRPAESGVVTVVWDDGIVLDSDRNCLEFQHPPDHAHRVPLKKPNAEARKALLSWKLPSAVAAAAPPKAPRAKKPAKKKKAKAPAAKAPAVKNGAAGKAVAPKAAPNAAPAKAPGPKASRGAKMCVKMFTYKDSGRTVPLADHEEDMATIALRYDELKADPSRPPFLEAEKEGKCWTIPTDYDEGKRWRFYDSYCLAFKAPKKTRNSTATRVSGAQWILDAPRNTYEIQFDADAGTEVPTWRFKHGEQGTFRADLRERE